MKNAIKLGSPATLQDSHVTVYYIHRFNTKFGGVSMYEIKRMALESSQHQRESFENKYPKVGDRVIFCSIDINGVKTMDYGHVNNIRVHDHSTGYALYTVTLETVVGDEKAKFQLYQNHPDETKQGEWIRNA